MPIYSGRLRSGFWNYSSHPKQEPIIKTVKVTDVAKPVQGIRSVTVSPSDPRTTYEILSKDTVTFRLYGGSTSTASIGERPGEYVSGYISTWNVEIDYTTNQPPNRPASISYRSDMRGGEAQDISWDTASDPDGNLTGYELQANVSGQGWVRIGTFATNVLQHRYSLAKGTSTIQFRVRAIDAEGDTSEWQTGQIVTVVNNEGPVITGIENIGSVGTKNHPFRYTYSVSDPDSDPVRIEESLNGIVFKTLSNAPQNQHIQTDVTAEMLFGLETNQPNRITIKASDGQGHVAYAYVDFERTNLDPTIAVESSNLGTKDAPFSLQAVISDTDGDDVSVVWKIGDTEIGRQEIAAGMGTIDIAIPKDVFLQLAPTSHTIRIEAVDARGGSASRNVSFKRGIARLHVKFLHSSSAIDVRPTHILVIPTWKVADGAIPQVLVCNNVNDASPNWEDATSAVLAGIKFPFANDTKTAAEWRIGVQIIIDKGTSTQQSTLSGLGGAVE